MNRVVTLEVLLDTWRLLFFFRGLPSRNFNGELVRELFALTVRFNGELVRELFALPRFIDVRSFFANWFASSPRDIT